MKILALESSTTSAKAMVYDSVRGIECVRSRPYGLGGQKGFADGSVGNSAGGSVQDAKQVFERTARLGRETADGGKIDLIVLGGAWHGVMLCDPETGEPKSPVYQWSYTGAGKMCRRLRGQEKYKKSYYEATGCMVNAIYPFFKLLFFQGQGADLSRFFLMGQGSYNFFRLTGKRAVMDSMASGSGLLDIRTGRYRQSLLDELGITQDNLSPVCGYRETQPLDAFGAKVLGLKAGIPVMTAGPDGGLNQIGDGGLRPGVMTMSVGTSGALRMSVAAPALSKEQDAWCYLSPKGWLSGAATSGCCNCVDWVRDKCMPRDLSYGDIEGRLGEAEDTPVFLPFLCGERCPGWDDERRGGFSGLTLEHTVYDLYRAVLEGVLFNLRQCYEILCKLNGEPEKIRLSGGILNSPYWTQMCADIFGRDMEVGPTEHSSLMGAVVLGMEVLGLISDAALYAPETVRVLRPRPEREKIYRDKYGRYLDRYREDRAGTGKGF